MSLCGYKYLEKSEVTPPVLMIHTFWVLTLCRCVFPDLSFQTRINFPYFPFSVHHVAFSNLMLG